MNDQITLEVCSNLEWLRENSGLDLERFDGDYMANEAAKALGQEIDSRLCAAGYETCSPRGQRSMYHGWNGANTFAWKRGPVGTFDDVSDAQQDEINSLVDAAVADVQERFSE